MVEFVDVCLLDILFGECLHVKLLWHCLADSGGIWRARALHVLCIVLLCFLSLLLLELVLEGEARGLARPGLFVLLVLVRCTSRPLLHLDHELLAAAPLRVASGVGSGGAIRLELLYVKVVHHGEAPLIPRGVYLQLLALTLVLLRRVLLRLLL